MNRNRNLKIKFCVDRYERNKMKITRKTGSRVDHIINDEKHVKLFHKKKEEANV